MTDYELEKINTERRGRGLPPLTRTQAVTAIASTPSRHDDGFNANDFLFGYVTGIPMPSAGGIIGAAMHPTPSYADPSPSYSAPDPAPSSPSNDSSPPSDGGGGGGGGE